MFTYSQRVCNGLNLSKDISLVGGCMTYLICLVFICILTDSDEPVTKVIGINGCISQGVCDFCKFPCQGVFIVGSVAVCIRYGCYISHRVIGVGFYFTICSVYGCDSVKIVVFVTDGKSGSVCVGFHVSIGIISIGFFRSIIVGNLRNLSSGQVIIGCNTSGFVCNGCYFS